MHRLTTQRLWRLVVVCLCVVPGLVLAQENKSVVGPSNPELTDGAQALKSGDAEEGGFGGGVGHNLRQTEYGGHGGNEGNRAAALFDHARSEGLGQLEGG